MADANINSGTPLRFDKAGLVRIGAAGSGFISLWLIPGTAELIQPDPEKIPLMDRGIRTTTVLVGDERQGSLKFSVRPSKAGMTSAADLWAKLKPAASGSLETLQTIEFDFIDNAGASTGTRVSAASCYMNNPLNVKAGGAGQNTDRIDIEFMIQGAVTLSTF